MDASRVHQPLSHDGNAVLLLLFFFKVINTPVFHDPWLAELAGGRTVDTEEQHR